jgi:hypothetical protein
VAGNLWRTGGDGSNSGRPFAKFDVENGQGWTIHANGASAPLQPGTPLIIDFLALKAGPVRWSPLDFSLLAPLDQPEPPQPEGYDAGFQVPLLFRGHNLAEITSSSSYVNSAFYALYLTYAQAPEAQQGRLPIYLLEPAVPITNIKHGRAFYKPAFKTTGHWTTRDPRIFRSPLTAPPQPRPPQTMAPGAQDAARLFENVAAPAAPAPTAQQAAAVAAARPRVLPNP